MSLTTKQRQELLWRYDSRCIAALLVAFPTMFVGCVLTLANVAPRTRSAAWVTFGVSWCTGYYYERKRNEVNRLGV
jgi:hypothetical protein